MSTKKLALGLMSGTSADGLTVCLFEPARKKVICFKNYPYAKSLQTKIINAAGMTTPQLSELNFELGRLYSQKAAQFIKEFNINKEDIAVIGSHGQTVWHAPLAKIPNTLQIGEAAFLARDLQIPVVYNFRPADMAAGGTGAPLMPAFDNFLFKDSPPKMLLNIGGISNIAAAGKGVEAFGFDLGPGNVLMDTAVDILTRGHKKFDNNGALAAKYEPDIKKAKKMLRKFTGKTPPASLDRNAYTKNFFRENFPELKEKDISTLTYLTAAIITVNIKKFILSRYNIKLLEVSGGGVYNKTLINFIAQGLPGIRVTSGKNSMDPMAKEAAAFAWFAWQTVKGKKSSCARATGAKESVLLGSIYNI